MSNEDYSVENFYIPFKYTESNVIVKQEEIFNKEILMEIDYVNSHAGHKFLRRLLFIISYIQL